MRLIGILDPMPNFPIHIIGVTIICAYLIGCLIVGFYKSRKIKNITEYTLGGKKFATIVIVSTIFATHIGASSTIGTVEKVYSLGLFFAVVCFFSPLLWLIMVQIFGKNIDQFNGCLSISDVMGKLYGETGRWITNTAAMVLSFGAVGIQVLATGYIFNYFLGMSHLNGILIGMGVLVCYSTFGGVRAVALTDVFQFFVFFVAIPVACIFALDDIGGFEGLVEKLPPDHLTIDLTSQNIWLFLSLMIYNLTPLVGGAFIQRFLIAQNSKQLIKSLKIIASVHLPLTIVICLIGFIMKANAPDIDPSTAFMYFVERYLYVGIKGLMIAGMLAVIMSTADSWLNYASILCAHDVCKRLFPDISDKQELNIARLSTLGIGIVGIFIALKGKGIMELVWAADNFWIPLITVPLSAGFLKFRTNSKSFIASSVVAVSFTCLGAYIEGTFATISLVLGLIGSTIGLFGMHYYQLWTGEIAKSIPGVVTPRGPGCLEQLYNLGLFVYIERKFKEQRPQFWPLTIFIALSCIIPLFFVHGTHDLMIIGAIAVTLCFFLHFLSYFPQKIQCYQSLFWYLALAFCCPFIASYQMVISHYQIFWLLNALFIMVFLGIFVDWLSYLMISALGIACAYIYHNYTVVGHREMIVTSYIGYFITYCYIIAAIIIKIIKGEQKAELHRKDIVGAAIAHEMMGPFATTQSALEALQTLLMRKVCPTASGEENNILHIEMKKADYDTLRKIADEIVDIAKDGKKTIDMLLMSLRDKIVADDIAIYSITNCIEEALLRYDFKPGEKKAVTFRKTNDFDFKGSKHFVKHILFNLLRNSFHCK